MRQDICDLLSGYQDDWLAAEERAAFRDHLADCPSCRDAVGECERIDSLLRRADEAAIVPLDLAVRIDREARLRRRRRKALMAGAGVALAASVALALWLGTRPDVIQESPPSRVPPETALAQPAPAVPSVRVTFSQSSGVIAQPVKSDNPAITIYWVYPVLKSQPEPAQEPGPGGEFQERNGS